MMPDLPLGYWVIAYLLCGYPCALMARRLQGHAVDGGEVLFVQTLWPLWLYCLLVIGIGRALWHVVPWLVFKAGDLIFWLYDL